MENNLKTLDTQFSPLKLLLFSYILIYISRSWKVAHTIIIISDDFLKNKAIVR